MEKALSHYASQTADIVAAYAANNALSPADLTAAIASVHQALVQAATGAVVEPEPEYMPIVSVKSSIKPDFLICLACGKRQTALKRHLSAAHGLTPEQYRARYDLPVTYPMAAPNYTEKRRQIAKDAGLGRKAN